MIKEKDDYAHCYVICRFDCCMVIDPSHDLVSIHEAIDNRRLTGILLTHAHADHVDLIGEFDVPIYMHELDAHLLFADEYNGYEPKKHPYQRKNLAFNFVKDGDRIPLADHLIEVFHTPGHTAGSLSFLYEGKLFTGDTLFKEDVGRHDLYSGSLSEIRKSIIHLCSLPANTKVYPGHDELTTIRDEQKKNIYFKKWSKQLK